MRISDWSSDVCSSDLRWPNVTSRRFVESAASLQLPSTADFNRPDNEGFGLYQVTQKGGERWSAARAYVEPLREHGNYAVRTGALVEKILIEEERKSGVEGKGGSVTVTIGDRRIIRKQNKNYSLH